MLAGAEVTVDDKYCTTLPSTEAGFSHKDHWSKFTCDGDGVSGSNIKITAKEPKMAVAMCGLKVYGVASPEGQIYKMNQEYNQKR